VALPDLELPVESRAQWGAWLVEHAAGSTGVRPVTWRRASGRTGVAYDDLDEEALCVGWVDSRPWAVVAERAAVHPAQARQRLGPAEQGAGHPAGGGRPD